MKTPAIISIVALIAVPVSAMITILLSPLWNWFEAKYRVESVGHSGPADWCYMVVYLSVLFIAVVVCFLLRKKPNKAPGPAA